MASSPSSPPLLGALKTGGRFLIRTVPVFLGFFVLLAGFAYFFRPDVTRRPADPDPAQLARVEEARAMSFDPAHPPRVAQEVDYRAGSAAAWWPKGEASVLAALVAQGKLPTVAARVGKEPLVLRGAEGIGLHGGTWQRLASSDFDVGQIAATLSYTNLVRWSPTGYPIVPHLARSWEISPDYRTFTFHLREGMRWSDGVPVTADDILYWYEQEVIGLQGMVPSVLVYPGTGEVAKVEKVDELSVRFSFSQPHVLFLERLASFRTIPNSTLQEYCVPAHYLRQYHPVIGDQELIKRTMRELNCPTPRILYWRMKEWRNPAQPRLWPWLLRERTDSSPYVFVRNPYYFAVDPAGNQLPYLDRLVIEVRPQELFALTAAAGQVSMQDRFIRYQDHVLLLGQAERNGYEVYHWYPGDRSTFTIFPVLNRKIDPDKPETRWKHQLLNDRRFRQALSLAINRRAIIDALFNGQTEPAQIEPGPRSEFHSQALMKSYTQYDPAGANARLDAIGLTQRDREGYRTYPDGTRMVWFLEMNEYTNNDPAEFIVRDWDAVGIRCVPRIRGRQFYILRQGALEHDFAVHTGESDFTPLIEPRNYVPTYSEAFYAPAYGYWYLFGGLRGLASANSPRAQAPPLDHPLRHSMERLLEINRTPDPVQRVAMFRQIEEENAENVWTISLATPPPQLVVVNKHLRNVPRVAVSQGAFESPGHTGFETYYWEKPSDPPATVAELSRVLQNPQGTAEATFRLLGSQPAGPVPAGHPWAERVGALAKWVLLGCLAAALVLVAWRHPFIARRLLWMIPTLAVISVVVFTIVQLPPGDFATTRENELLTQGTVSAEAQIKELRETYHLDESMTKRYLRWSGLLWFTTFSSNDTGLLQGDLGRSMEFDRPVNAVVGERIVLTVLVSLATVLFTWILAIPIGIYSAVRQYSAGDYALTLFGFVGMSVPGFLLALVLMFFAHRYFGLSVSGLFSPEFATTPGWPWGKVVDLLKHIWIPTLVIGLGGTASMIRVMRANLLDELRKPYVVTARAKGLSETRLLLRYPVRLALNPFISGLGSLFPQLVSGGAIVAIVLSLPMIGPVMVNSLLAEDVYLAGSMLMVLSLLGVLGTLVSDLLLLALDPRIRLQGAR